MDYEIELFQKNFKNDIERRLYYGNIIKQSHIIINIH